MESAAPAVRRVLIVFGMALLAGCFTVPERDRLMATGRYAELAKFSEAEVADDPRTFKLHRLCVAYSNLKRYDKLFQCLDRLNSNIRRGDKWMYSFEDIRKIDPDYGKNIKDRYGFGDVVPYYHLLRAQAHLELAQYDRAIAEASTLASFNRYGTKSVTTHQIDGYALLGLAQALKGNRNESWRYASELQRTPILPHQYSSDLYDSVRKQVGLTRIYLSLAAYQEALSAIRKDDHAGDRAVSGMLMSALVGMGESWTLELEIPRQLMLAKALLETNQLGDARSEFDSLLRKDQAKQNGELYRIALFERGRIAEMEKNPAEAIDFYRKAVDVIDEQRSSANTEAAKIGFVADKQEPYRRLIRLLVQSGQYQAAFEYVERARARALVDMLVTKRDFVASSVRSDQVKELLAMRESAQSEASGFDTSGSTVRARNLVVEIDRKIAQAAPDVASLTSVTFARVPALQRQIGQDEAILEYYFDGARLYLFVLTTSGLGAASIDAPDLAAKVQAFRNAVQQWSDDRSHRVASAALYDVLVRPVEPLLANRNLIVVPYGPIHYVAFGALYDRQAFLVDRWSYRVLPSASVLPLLRRTHQSKAGELLAFGNPDLGDPRWDLKNAQTEAVTVAGLFPNSRVFVRRQADKAAFRRYASGFRYLHLATHGSFNAESPMNSALFLAGRNTREGALTVGDLYTMDLDVDLVTLSACETGLGRVTSGDDVVGLTRGFLYAGASSIVASLWQVDDLSTSELMTTFYRELPARGKREALREAVLQTKRKYPHPFFWGAFQLTGADR